MGSPVDSGLTADVRCIKSKGSTMNSNLKLEASLAALLLALALPAAANDDFMRELARTDGDFQGASATTAKDAAREPARPMTREDLAFLSDLARPDGLGIAAPVETPSGTAVATR
jgi:hypothetical protein